MILLCVILAQGIRDLFWLPVEQYKRDGRFVRGMQRGATSFSTSTAMAMLELTNRAVQSVQVNPHLRKVHCIYCESRNIRRLDLVKFVINKIISLMKIFMVSCLMWLYKKMIFSSGKTMSDLKSTKFNLQKQFCFCTCVHVYWYTYNS